MTKAHHSFYLDNMKRKTALAKLYDAAILGHSIAGKCFIINKRKYVAFATDFVNTVRWGPILRDNGAKGLFLVKNDNPSIEAPIQQGHKDWRLFWYNWTEFPAEMVADLISTRQCFWLRRRDEEKD